MPDLSKSTARPSPTGRSRANVPDAPGPAVRSQDFARDVSGEGARAKARGRSFGALAAGLTSLIPGALAEEKNEHVDRMREIEKENIEFARLANRSALAKPGALRKALETGNREGFKDVPADALSVARGKQTDLEGVAKRFREKRKK